METDGLVWDQGLIIALSEHNNNKTTINLAFIKGDTIQSPVKNLNNTKVSLTDIENPRWGHYYFSLKVPTLDTLDPEQGNVK